MTHFSGLGCKLGPGVNGRDEVQLGALLAAVVLLPDLRAAVLLQQRTDIEPRLLEHLRQLSRGFV